MASQQVRQEEWQAQEERMGTSGGVRIYTRSEQERYRRPEQEIYRRSPRVEWQQREPQDERTVQLARSLGWFSLGLGLAQLAAPGAVARLIGIRSDHDNTMWLRRVGLREIATGVGILAQPHSPTWFQLRLLGDAMDLALLGTAMNADSTAQNKTARAAIAVAGVTAVDLLFSQQLRQQQPDARQFERRQYERTPADRAPSVPHEEGIRVEEVITVNRSPQEIYAFWRNFENLPSFMSHLDTVQVIDEQRSHWRAKAPAGLTLGWDAEIIDDTPGERISWRSLEGSAVPNAGSVQFRPATGGRGTVVSVVIEYKPPGGAVGAAIAKLFGQEPSQQVQNDLRAFKQVMETGEVIRSDATLRSTGLTQPAAQPPEQKELERATR